jgi:hypothetical protein
MKPDINWIPGPWRGRLAIAARPRGGDWLEDELKGWSESGVKVVVSLLETDEAIALGVSRRSKNRRREWHRVPVISDSGSWSAGFIVSRLLRLSARPVA